MGRGYLFMLFALTKTLSLTSYIFDFTVAGRGGRDTSALSSLRFWKVKLVGKSKPPDPEPKIAHWLTLAQESRHDTRARLRPGRRSTRHTPCLASRGDAYAARPR